MTGDDELDEEIQSHLDMAARDSTPQAARREFGNVGQVKELTRSMWAGASIDRLGQEARFASRSLRRTPGFAMSVILILGLGIGMASAMYTVFRQVVVGRLPVQDQEQIIELSGVVKGTGGELGLFPAQFQQYRRQRRTLQSVAGFAHWGAVVQPVVDGERQLSVRQSVVTGNFFEVLGSAPVLGRLLRPQDDPNFNTVTEENPSVAVLSYDAWRRSFGGDSGVIGRHLRIPELKWTLTVVGVAPPGLDYPRGVELWTANTYSTVDLVARLAPGVSIEDTRAEYLSFIKADPDYIKNGIADQVGTRARALEEMVFGDVKPALMVLTIAVGVLLLLTCVNVGNLLLFRAAGRARELAMRRALGAGPGDILRQLLAEAAILGIIGGAAGLAFAQALLGLLLWLAPSGLPRLDMIRIAPAPLTVAVTTTVLTILLFGLLPALGVLRVDLSAPLRADMRGGTEGRRMRGVRRALVASQVALALVLLSGAGLLVRSFARLSGLDMGFATSHLSVLRMTMPWDKWIGPCGGDPPPPPSDSVRIKRVNDCVYQTMVAFHAQVMDRLHAIRGVEKTSPVSVPPFMGINVFMTRMAAEGQSASEAAANPWVGYEFAGPEYFETLGLPILRGRAFSEADRFGSPDVAIVTEGVARLLWPGQDPIGKHMNQAPGQSLWTVVGLVADIHFREHRHSTPMVIRPYRQTFAQGTILARIRGGLAVLVPAMKEAVRGVDPDAELVAAETMDEVIAPQLAQPRLNALLLAAFASVAVLLAAIGLYGIMASAVAQQTRELGVRLALGATPNRLRKMVLGQALTVAGFGAAVGLVGALAGSRLLTTMLFEVSPTDPVTLIGVSLLLLAVALLAAYLPARRATRIDPARALRAE